MKQSRRDFLQLSLASALGSLPVRALGQGVSDRHVKAQSKAPRSGVPFRASLIDIASQAGLRMPTIYGPVDHKDYIVEAVGCGCAFIDYDNDGWIDIFLLCGTRRESAPADAMNRLYRHFLHLLRPKQTLSEQRQWNLYGRYKGGGPHQRSNALGLWLHLCRSEPQRPS